MLEERTFKANSPYWRVNLWGDEDRDTTSLFSLHDFGDPRDNRDEEVGKRLEQLWRQWNVPDIEQVNEE